MSTLTLGEQSHVQDTKYPGSYKYKCIHEKTSPAAPLIPHNKPLVGTKKKFILFMPSEREWLNIKAQSKYYKANRFNQYLDKQETSLTFNC